MRRSVLLISCGVASFAAHAAAAQSTPEQGEEIVVTAQKREQVARDVPVSMTILGGDALKSQAIVTLQDLAPRLSNVNITPAVTSDILSIRGIASGFNTGFEQAVGTFVDGVYRGRARSMRIALFDIDRLEVLKGPQTIFFGKSAIAGAFNITTRKPQPGEPAQANASALYAPTDGELNLEAGVSVPLGQTTAVRVAARYSGMDGYLYNGLTRQDEPRLRNAVGRVSFAWEPDDSFHMDLRVDGGRVRDKGTAASEIFSCPPSPAIGLPARGACASYSATGSADTAINFRGDKPASSYDLDFVETALTNTLDLGSHSLTSITSYYWHDSVLKPILVPVPTASPIGRNNWFDTVWNENYDEFAQELRLDAERTGALEYTLGLYYSNAKLSGSTYAGFFFAPFGAFAPPYTAATPVVGTYWDTRKDDTYSAYGAATLHLSEALRLNAGLRYSVVRKEGHRSGTIGSIAATAAVNDGFVPGTPTQQATLGAILGILRTDFPNTRRTDRALMPSIGLQYELSSRVTAYAKYVRGEKAGGWSSGLTANEFEEEKVDAFEVGVKGDAFDRVLQFTLAAFYSKYDDLQEASNNVLPGGAVLTVVSNVAKATSQGIEASATIRASDRLQINLDASYLDTRFDSYANASCNSIQAALTPAGTACFQDLSGRVRPFAPKWSGSVGFAYTQPIGANELRFEPSLYFKSGYFTLSTLDPLSLQDGFAKLDARLSYGPRDRGWEIAVIGKNLTDRTTALLNNVVISSPGSAYVQPDRPLSVAIQLSARF